MIVNKPDQVLSFGCFQGTGLFGDIGRVKTGYQFYANSGKQVKNFQQACAGNGLAQWIPIYNVLGCGENTTQKRPRQKAGPYFTNPFISQQSLSCG